MAYEIATIGDITPTPMMRTFEVCIYLRGSKRLRASFPTNAETLQGALALALFWYGSFFPPVWFTAYVALDDGRPCPADPDAALGYVKAF